MGEIAVVEREFTNLSAGDKTGHLGRLKLHLIAWRLYGYLLGNVANLEGEVRRELLVGGQFDSVLRGLFETGHFHRHGIDAYRKKSSGVKAALCGLQCPYGHAFIRGRYCHIDAGHCRASSIGHTTDNIACNLLRMQEG